MMMNKILTFIVVLFTAMSVYAAHDPEEYRVKVIKSDGTVVDGYSKTDFLSTYFPKVTKFTFSKKYDGEETTFTSDEVKRVEFVNLAIDDIPLVFESVQAQSRVPVTSGHKPKLYKTRVFLRLFYDGKNVKGYTQPYSDITNTPSASISSAGWTYYYMIKGTDVAKGYWFDMQGIIFDIKRRLKVCLKNDFPEVTKMLDDKEISTKKFRKDPTMLLPLMDNTYKKQ